MGVPIFKMLTIGILPSPLKVLYYKSKGAKIGRKVSIGLFSIIRAKEIEIGDYSKIGFLSFITARKVIIGKRSKIHSTVAIDTGEFIMKNDSVIMEQVVIGGMLTSRSKISIGHNVKIFTYCFINPTEAIIIEDEVGVGGSNYIFTHGSWQSKIDGFPVSFGPVTIKKGVWLPWRVFIMPNVTIHEYATIGAGSIITKDIPAYTLAAGSPAKALRSSSEYIKNYSPEEKRKILFGIMDDFDDYLKYSTQQDTVVEKDIARAAYKIAGKTKEVVLVNDASGLDQNFTRGKHTSVICMQELDTATRTLLTQQSVSWFDLEKRETFFQPTAAWKTTRDFLSRYGIRFYTYPD